MNIFSSLTKTIGGVLNLIDTNLDTLESLSKAGNTKAKSFSNALSFDEEIRQTLRGSKEYKKARMKAIISEETEKLKEIKKQNTDDTDDTDDTDSLSNDISDMISNIKF